MRKTLHIILLLSAGTLSAAAQDVFSGQVLDGETRKPVVGAAVSADNAWTLTDSLGRFSLKAASILTITSLGYKTLRTAPVRDGTYFLQSDIYTIQEVIVTATEDRGLTAASRIGEEAISHIQPSSIADLLELLPGGKAVDPAFGSPQIVNLRAAGSLSSDYATSALGTRFLIDGKPLGNDANLQYTPAYSNLGSSHVNLGTDMRTLPTEEIESVEVVRGIASVEYGDLTSGLFKVNRKQGGKDLRARLKSDMKSTLFYVGKGMERGDREKATLNAGLNYLDAKADPRNPRQGYRRLTGSLRAGKTWDRTFLVRWNASLDYTGSFDDQKSDLDLDWAAGRPMETYRSSYHKMALGSDFTLASKETDRFFRSLSATASLTYERDLIDRWKYIALGTEQPMVTALEPGEHEAIMLPTRYEATLQVDGRPFYAWTNVVASFRAGRHRLKAGAEWTMDKNYGKGTLFDPERPFSPSMIVRPRPFDAIPAHHQLSLFAEDNGTRDLGAWRVEWMAGIRLSALTGAGRAYAIDGKPYADPRANLRLDFPAAVLRGYKLEAGLYGGLGWHTKFPTMDQLCPEPLYGDITQFNYWPKETDLRRIDVLVYRIDPTNPDLGPARNLKQEVGADLSWNGFSLSVNYFREGMTSGFRHASGYIRVVSKDYDESAVDKSTLTGPPDLAGIPYVLDTLLKAYGFTNNGSRTLKQGVECTFTTRRIPVILTRATLTGAWFLTRYENSMPEYYRPSITLGGKAYPYIGIYDATDRSLHTSLTTNLMLDTQVPRLGLIVSTAFQTTWFTDYRPLIRDGYPYAYLDKDLVEHPFTEASREDPVLHAMVRGFSAMDYDYRVPFAMNVNLKVTKKIYHETASLSLFVNRIFDVTPDYRANGTLNRRNVNPYFGMELDFRL